MIFAIISLSTWIVAGVLTIFVCQSYESLKVQYILCWIALLCNLIVKVAAYL